MRGSDELKSLVDVWGPMGDGFALMRTVKERFDPDRILNPGRGPGAAARQDHRARRVLPALWGRRGPKGLPAPTAHRVLGALKGHRELKDRGVRTARRGQRARRARHVRASRPLRTLGAGRSGWACRTCRACRAHRPERQLSRIYRGDGPQRR